MDVDEVVVVVECPEVSQRKLEKVKCPWQSVRLVNRMSSVKLGIADFVYTCQEYKVFVLYIANDVAQNVNVGVVCVIAASSLSSHHHPQVVSVTPSLRLPSLVLVLP